MVILSQTTMNWAVIAFIKLSIVIGGAFATFSLSNEVQQFTEGGFNLNEGVSTGKYVSQTGRKGGIFARNRGAGAYRWFNPKKNISFSKSSKGTVLKTTSWSKSNWRRQDHSFKITKTLGKGKLSVIRRFVPK